MKKSIFLSLVLLSILSYTVTAQSSGEGNKTKAVLTDPNAKTAFEWDLTVYDFGTIEYGVPKTAEFILTNTGTTPILVINAKGSCGCTAIKYPKEPIQPGKTAKIKATYNAASSGKFNKTVTVFLNVEEDNKHVLHLKGEVAK